MPPWEKSRVHGVDIHSHMSACLRLSSLSLSHRVCLFVYQSALLEILSYKKTAAKNVMKSFLQVTDDKPCHTLDCACSGHGEEEQEETSVLMHFCKSQSIGGEEE